MPSTSEAASKRPRGNSAPRKTGRPPVFAASDDAIVLRQHRFTGGLANRIASESAATGETKSDVVQRRLDRDYKAHPVGGKPRAARKAKSAPAPAGVPAFA